MSGVTAEQKLQLVQQIRQQYRRNRYDMSSREQILYGSTGDNYAPEDEDFDREAPPVSSLGPRTVLAILLFAAVVLLDVNGLSIGEFTSEKLFGLLSADYEYRITEWLAAFSAK